MSTSAPPPPAPRKIRLVRPTHVRYTHTDLDAAHRFLLDFGFAETKRVGADTVYYRGYGPDPWVYCATRGDKCAFGGVGFVVESEEDLQVAAATLPGASAVRELSEAPGGGRGVTFRDPVDGFEVHLVFGQRQRQRETERGAGEQAGEEVLPNGNPMQLRFNYPEDKQRPPNSFQRFKKAPAPVYKLGHVGLCVTDFARTFDFYTTRFNFLPSELIYKPGTADDGKGGEVFNTFCRLDRGKELVDHHCFFFFHGPAFHVHHSSFETHDFDTQVLGHDWLRGKGYELSWGVGRHIYGSQIFDYWFDPSKFIVEHYVDGDLLDNTHPTQRNEASRDSIHVWGPDLPDYFLD